ncbi:DUF3093 family protein [Nocardia sp. IFM 10818]
MRRPGPGARTSPTPRVHAAAQLRPARGPHPGHGPADPTSYVYVSTRTPERLVTALGVQPSQRPVPRAPDLRGAGLRDA